jgi:hypothetical protein
MTDSQRSRNPESLQFETEEEEAMDELEEGQEIVTTHVVAFGLTKGQWLSIGIVVLIVAGTVGASVWCFSGTCGS